MRAVVERLRAATVTNPRNRPLNSVRQPQVQAARTECCTDLRELAPGVFLGRFSKRCPCQELEGYFVLEFGCECCGAK